VAPSATLTGVYRRDEVAAHTDNSVHIEAPLELVWEVTNRVADWPRLFTEYAEASILEQRGDTVVFRLTTHPDENGKAWSWVSERTPDSSSHTVTARRIETGPFEYMNIRWTYQSEGNGTLMRWMQDFQMKPDAPVDDAGMAARINENTPIQMRAIKARLEEMARGRASSASTTG
jgi:aromatase